MIYFLTWELVITELFQTNVGSEASTANVVAVEELVRQFHFM